MAELIAYYNKDFRFGAHSLGLSCRKSRIYPDEVGLFTLLKPAGKGKDYEYFNADRTYNSGRRPYYRPSSGWLPDSDSLSDDF
jgi:hypothetical protein